MKKDGKYRFSLQFAAVTEEQIQVGDFLERLGNRKSAVIVDALAEYLASHPEFLDPAASVTICVENNLSRSALESLVRSIIGECLSSMTLEPSVKERMPEVQESLEQDITEMLGNLDMFL